ncbi:hypothetical protein AHAS_Ahas13G0164400 [Arachis hypogaea]
MLGTAVGVAASVLVVKPALNSWLCPRRRAPSLALSLSRQASVFDPPSLCPSSLSVLPRRHFSSSLDAWIWSPELELALQYSSHL